MVEVQQDNVAAILPQQEGGEVGCGAPTAVFLIASEYRTISGQFCHVSMQSARVEKCPGERLHLVAPSKALRVASVALQ